MCHHRKLPVPRVHRIIGRPNAEAAFHWVQFPMAQSKSLQEGRRASEFGCVATSVRRGTAALGSFPSRPRTLAKPKRGQVLPCALFKTKGGGPQISRI